LNSSTAGILSIVSACIIWGFAPIYYKLLVSVPPFELLSHRTLWSFIFFFAVLGLRAKLKSLKAAVFSFKGQFPIILLASVLIAINWFFFIYAIQTNQTTEASLGLFHYATRHSRLGFAYFQ
jgi:chloramphenicol-sensitive protein RarD